MMSERDNESFDLDEEFLAEAEDNTDYDRILDKVDRRVRPQPGTPKRGKAAWSRLEEVLADRRLEKDLQDAFDEALEDDFREPLYENLRQVFAGALQPATVDAKRVAKARQSA